MSYSNNYIDNNAWGKKASQNDPSLNCDQDTIDTNKTQQPQIDIDKSALEKMKEQWQTKLLDTSKKNSLLNYKIDSAQNFYLVGKTILEIEETIKQNGTITITAVPNPIGIDLIRFGVDPEIKVQDWLPYMGISPNRDLSSESFKRPETADKLKTLLQEICGGQYENISEVCQKLGWDNDLPERLVSAYFQDWTLEDIEQKYKGTGDTPEYLLDLDVQENELLALSYAENLNKRLTKLFREGQQAYEEKGIQIIHFIIGFLVWNEVNDPDTKLYAPLIAIPASVNRKKVKGLELFEFTPDPESACTNYSLQERLKADYGFELPDYDPAQSFDAYLEEVELQAREYFKRSTTRLNILRYATVGRLSFAKIVMWKDLESLDPETLATGTPLQACFSTNSQAEYFDDSEYAIDDIPGILSEKGIPLVTQADSSQHSAIIDVIDHRKNLIIEGPPGTGKSQTITNLIACAMGRGLSVLFVSEKQAALEVVRNRMQALGLDDFCLTLHSTKADKKEVLNSLRKRREGSYSNPSAKANFVRLQTQYELQKGTLNDYVAFVNTPWKTSEKTVHEILGAYTHALSNCPKTYLRRGLGDLRASDLTPAQRADILKEAHTFENIYKDLSNTSGVQSHPWHGIVNAELCNDRQAEETIGLLKKFQASLLKLQNEYSAIFSDQPLPDFSQKTIGTVTSEINFLNELTKCSNSFDYSVFKDISNPTIAKAVNDYLDKIKSTHAQYETCARFLNPSSIAQIISLSKAPIPDLSMFQNIGKCSITLQELADDEQNLRELINQAQQTTEVLNEYRQELPNDIASHICFTSTGVTFLERMIECLADLRPEDLSLRKQFLTVNDVKFKLEELLSAEDKFKKKFSSLEQKVSLDKLPNETELSILLSRIENTGFFGRLFNSEYKTAMARLGECTQWDRVSIIGAKNQLIEYAREHVDIDSRQEFKHKLQSLYDWYLNIKEKFGSGYGRLNPAGRALMQADDAMLEVIRQIRDDFFPTFNSYRQTFESLTKKLRRHLQITAKGLDATTYETFADELKTNVDSLQAFYAIPTAKLSDLAQYNEAVIDLTHNLEQLKNKATTLSSLSWFCPISISETSLESNAFEFMSQVGNLLTGNEQLFSDSAFTELVSSLNNVQHRLSVFEKLRLAFNTLGIVHEQYSEFVENALINEKVWIGNGSFKSISEKNEHALSHADTLTGYANFIRQMESLKQYHLYHLALEVVNDHIDIANWMNIVRLEMWSVLTHDIESDKRAANLLQIFGKSLEASQKAFAQYDNDLQVTYREVLAATIDSRSITPGTRGARVESLTELSLIDHEIDKERRHIPIRQLIKRAGKALRELKPCWMMSPLSVSQFIEPKCEKFDLIVMDEASQIKPEDAIALIARGKQVVVVGDPKQLPPTSFFDRLQNDDTVSEQIVGEKSESILDYMGQHFPKRTLRWHYRSRHESLIQFSNHAFYDNKLIVFPSPAPKSDEFGIRFKYIENGVFDSNQNKVEAMEVVDAIIEHARNHENESLGVVCMNVKQEELLNDFLDMRTRNDKNASFVIDRLMKKQEKLFIKNLENVQGDERDVIFISFTYGPDHLSGKVMQRFGPIASEVGWRRLNVLFTRARKRMHVFSSMHFTDILPSANSNSYRSVSALKGFLHMAETGRIPVGKRESGRAPDSEFEVAVMNLLRSYGFECQPQIGTAGFFIDIGVLNPNNKDEYLMGIECDGATYHSAKSARDRDILRQEILEGLGWKIRRIWSTDWFRSPEQAIAPIVKELTELIRTGHEPKKPAGVESFDQTPDVPKQDQEQLPDIKSFVKPEQKLSDGKHLSQAVALKTRKPINKNGTFDPSGSKSVDSSELNGLLSNLFNK